VSREKLEQLGFKLPILPTTSVGSFPKPPYLLEARRKFRTRQIGPEKLRELEERAVREWIITQEKIGLDVLVDGEMYRGDMATFFAENLEGFKIGGLVRSYGNRYYRKPVIVGKVRWRGPITVEWWRFAQGLTEKPVKGMVTGPYTLMDWTFNEYYLSRRDACFALAKVIREEVKALAEAGAKIIQIDEPAISARPEELPEFAVDAMRLVVKGIDAYVINHICYGAFEFIYPGMLELPADNFDLEMSNSELDLVNLFRDHPFTKDISFGVVDVHSHVVEKASLVKKRVDKALEVLKPEQLWIDPDCGMKTRTYEEAVGKLQVMVKIVEAARNRIKEG
jgi:5-methyltetrahydropteroyltriglutamate--homocysteine methyltransferase